MLLEWTKDVSCHRCLRYHHKGDTIVSSVPISENDSMFIGPHPIMFDYLGVLFCRVIGSFLQPNRVSDGHLWQSLQIEEECHLPLNGTICTLIPCKICQHKSGENERGRIAFVSFRQFPEPLYPRALASLCCFDEPCHHF